ncbi:MAG: ATP-grasp domain-containing protein [Candidatus Omnitrophica bacterium]|nr:ATP-grasp domain-containing protein [Candidatus Omnitrophota bacterium]
MLKVALVYNLKRPEYKQLCADYCSEFDSAETIEAIAAALRLGGNQVFLIEQDRRLIDNIRTNNVDIVFNIAEGFSGPSREAQVPAMLDFLNIPYTGSGVLALALSLDKAMSKQIFVTQGIPTPRFQLFKNAPETLNPNLCFPLIVKPNCEGSAKGIHSTSVVKDKLQLVEEISRVKKNYRQDVLVEEFIQGRELTVAILGNDPPEVLPILEIDFTDCKNKKEFFYSWEVKEYQGIDPRYPDPKFFCPAHLSVEQEKQVKNVALAAHQALGCQDLSRVDIILGQNSNIYVLEVNPLPGLDPQESNLTKIAQAAGLSYPDLINSILASTVKRQHLVQSTEQQVIRREVVKK